MLRQASMALSTWSSTLSMAEEEGEGPAEEEEEEDEEEGRSTLG